MIFDDEKSVRRPYCGLNDAVYVCILGFGHDFRHGEAIELVYALLDRYRGQIERSTVDAALAMAATPRPVARRSAHGVGPIVIIFIVKDE